MLYLLEIPHFLLPARERESFPILLASIIICI